MKMKVEHRKHAVLGLVLILLLSSLVLMASAASSLRYIVSVNSAPVNLRWEPTREARVITKVKTGKTVTVLGEEGNWSKVRVDGRVGWVMTIFLSETDPLLKPEAERYILSPNSMPVNVRRDASRFSRVEDKLVTGAKVKILEVVGEWAKVQVTETGETGYVLASYLTPENPYTEEEISTTGRTVYVISEGGGDVNVRN